MRSAIVICSLVLVPVVASADPARAAEERSFTGYARHPKTGELLYTEVHRELAREDGAEELETSYYDASGISLAERLVDFSVDPLAPQFSYLDLRTGYREGVRYREEGLVVVRRAARSARTDERVLERSADQVVDAGFDRLVRASWDRLMAGERLSAEFVIPSRLRTLEFEFAKLEEGVVEGQPAVTFKMAFTNPVVRLLAGSVKVTYHRDQRFLMRYEGLSNVSDPAGDNYTVRIDFPVAERSVRLIEHGESSVRKVSNGE